MGNGRMSTPYARLKSVVVAPMLSAIVRMTTAAKPGLRTSIRAASRRSCRASSSHASDRASRCRSLVSATLPMARRAAMRSVVLAQPAASIFSLEQREMGGDLAIEIGVSAAAPKGAEESEEEIVACSHLYTTACSLVP